MCTLMGCSRDFRSLNLGTGLVPGLLGALAYADDVTLLAPKHLLAEHAISGEKIQPVRCFHGPSGH